MKEFDSLLMQFEGGGFVLGMPPAAPMYWRYMQENLEMRGKSPSEGNKSKLNRNKLDL